MVARSTTAARILYEVDVKDDNDHISQSDHRNVFEARFIEEKDPVGTLEAEDKVVDRSEDIEEDFSSARGQ